MTGPGNPHVSVLMSSHNGSRWLDAAIESVLAQSFRNFEFIIVDDGSTDDTPAIIQRYADRDARIVPISTEHSGLTASLNVGLARARGTWIARLDDDDTCEPTRLAEQTAFLSAHPEVVLLGSGFLEIDEDGHVVRRHAYPADHRTLLQHLRRRKRFFPHSSAMFRRDALAGAPIYNPAFRKSQDMDLWLRLSETGAIACLPAPLVRVRKHPFQVSATAKGFSQVVYGTAAVTCYFLRRGGGEDPLSRSGGGNPEDFLRWIDSQLTVLGAHARGRAWADARAAYFSAGGGGRGLLRFAVKLLRSGQALSLLLERRFGSTVPERLARAWLRRGHDHS